MSDSVVAVRRAERHWHSLAFEEDSEPVEVRVENQRVAVVAVQAGTYRQFRVHRNQTGTLGAGDLVGRDDPGGLPQSPSNRRAFAAAGRNWAANTSSIRFDAA